MKNKDMISIIFDCRIDDIANITEVYNHTDVVNGNTSIICTTINNIPVFNIPMVTKDKKVIKGII